MTVMILKENECDNIWFYQDLYNRLCVYNHHVDPLYGYLKSCVIPYNDAVWIYNNRDKFKLYKNPDAAYPVTYNIKRPEYNESALPTITIDYNCFGMGVSVDKSLRSIDDYNRYNCTGKIIAPTLFDVINDITGNNKVSYEIFESPVSRCHDDYNKVVVKIHINDESFYIRENNDIEITNDGNELAKIIYRTIFNKFKKM